MKTQKTTSPTLNYTKVEGDLLDVRIKIEK